MRKLFSTLCAGALALSMATPALAQGQDTTGLSSNRGPYMHHGDGYRMARDGRHHRDRGDRHHHGFYRHGGYGWYNGHRGYRNYHHGYRYYNGWWFPGAAFIGGAIIGSAIANSPSYGSAHVRWCYDRYRSYRASDNTYQPYHGPRRQCRSPYD
jgi:hypothetical protein